MKAFIAAIVVLVGISFMASFGLETVDMSAESVNSSSSVRLD